MLPSKSDIEILENIRNGDDSAVEFLYQKFRDSFYAWARGAHSLDDIDLADCWSDAIIAFVRVIRIKSDFVIQNTIEGYLFGIFSTMIQVKIRKKKKEKGLVVVPIDGISEKYLEFIPEEEDSDFSEKALQYMATLGEKERLLLEARFYKNLSLNQIREQLNYGSLSVVSASITRAKNKLKENIKKSLQKKQHN